MLVLKSQISLTPLTKTSQKQNTILKPNLHIQTHSFTNVTLKSSRKVNESSKVNGDEVPRVKVKWGELLLDPDRDNVVAVGLTGALVWAGVHVLWHLFLVIMAVLMGTLLLVLF
ncbi:hypothetical protein CTI12_AA243970 [Artemisia annua]|uniref:Transmembrane protein n=1 Tax=Artemisia annua TaxID=35608 RepID=A0A2U1NNZ1_ARTAN|nr:hypothetical protein CTI12_AA243970 [Artemisia annua]